MTKPDTLLGAVADAIATADVDGATYEDLARAALDAQVNWRFGSEPIGAYSALGRISNQEDDGA